MYVIGRDGKASMIDMWMKEPKKRCRNSSM